MKSKGPAMSEEKMPKRPDSNANICGHEYVRLDSLHVYADAAEARIAELEAQLERERWISVEERPPKVGDWVWVVCDGYTQRQAARRMYSGEWEWADADAILAAADAVTHWRPLPAPPTGKEKQ